MHIERRAQVRAYRLVQEALRKYDPAADNLIRNVGNNRKANLEALNRKRANRNAAVRAQFARGAGQ
jgi:hypothetical protein